MLELGKKIKKLRTEKDYSARELSERSGVARSLISQLETGKRQSTGMDTVDRIARALDVPLSYLITDESNPVSTAPYKNEYDYRQFLIKEENRSYIQTLQKAKMAGLTPDLLDEFIDLIIRTRSNPSSK